MSDGGLMTSTEVARRLGISRATFYRKRRQLDHLKVSRPLGMKKYSRFLVEQFCKGESTVRLGKRIAS